MHKQAGALAHVMTNSAGFDRTEPALIKLCLVYTLIERKQKGEAIIKENDLRVLSLLSCLLVYHP